MIIKQNILKGFFFYNSCNLQTLAVIKQNIMNYLRNIEHLNQQQSYNNEKHLPHTTQKL